MTVTIYDLRRGAYYDSVVLMQLQRGLIALPGILDAGVVMATPATCSRSRAARASAVVTPWMEAGFAVCIE